MKVTDRLNSFIHPWMVKYVCRTYNKKMAWCKKRHPELFKPVDAEVTRQHLALWGKLGLPCSDKWLRFLSNISGKPDYRYCPEDLFYGCVERILNDCERQYHSADDKNALNLYVEQGDQARTILRYIRGAFYDADHQFVSESQAKKIIASDQGDLIGKACVKALGGHSISCFHFEKGKYVTSKGQELTLDFIKQANESYLLQEKIEQSDFCAQFNPASANSCKVTTLRCPWDGKIDVVAAGMRFGVTQDVFDNLSSGGIAVAVNPKTGELGSTAHNWFRADPFKKHPSTGIEFAGKIHPSWPEMRAMAIKYAARVPYMNIISWDMITDKNGKVRMIEANEASQSTDWLQYDFGGLFGEYTEGVVEWCAAHKQFDHFDHFRTWY